MRNFALVPSWSVTRFMNSRIVIGAGRARAIPRRVTPCQQPLEPGRASEVVDIAQTVRLGYRP